MKHYKIMSLLLALLFLSACERGVYVDVPYAAQNLLEIDAQVAVGEYSYTPQSPLGHREIAISPLADAVMPDILGVYYQKAVQKEFRFSGISLKEGKCRLRGVLHKLLTTHGTSVLNIEASHVLYDEADNILYTNTHANARYLESLDAYRITAQINTAISRNIGKLLEDEAFRKALKKC